MKKCKDCKYLKDGNTCRLTGGSVNRDTSHDCPDHEKK